MQYNKFRLYIPLITHMMLSESYDIEMDITDSFVSNPSTTQIPSSSHSTLINQQPELSNVDLSSHSAPNHAPAHIQVETDRHMGMSILWVNSVSEAMRIGSSVQINKGQEVYEVMKVIKRSAKKDILLCISNEHAIGLVVDKGYFESSWNEFIIRNLLFTFFPCLFLL